jgi:hypothetical protein
LSFFTKKKNGKHTGKAKGKRFIDENVLAQNELSLFWVGLQQEVEDGRASVFSGVLAPLMPLFHLIDPLATLL